MGIASGLADSSTEVLSLAGEGGDSLGSSSGWEPLGIDSSSTGEEGGGGEGEGGEEGWLDASPDDG